MQINHSDRSVQQAMLQKAQQAAQAGRLDDAERVCRELLAKWPRQPTAWHLLGGVLYGAGRHHDAIVALKQAVDTGPLILDGWRGLAQVFLAQPEISMDVLIFLRENVTSLSFQENDRIELARQLLKTLGFLKSGDREHCEMLYEHLVLPWLRWGLDSGHYDFALFLEERIYNEYIKQVEEKAHFEACYRELAPPLLEKARKFSQQLPCFPVSRESRPRVAFLLHNAYMLAHTEALFAFLEGWAKLESRPFDCVVYCLELKQGELSQRLAALGVPLIGVSSNSLPKRDTQNFMGFYGYLIRLREMLMAAGVSALVWVSIPQFMTFAFGLRLAPVQVWWAMKYHGLAFPEVDGYLTGGSLAPTRLIDGRTWRSGLLGLAGWFDPTLTDRAAEVRRAFPSHRLLTGTLGREEKLANPDYLSTICALLQQHPDVGFLWTGRVAVPAIQKAFEQAGVASRCHFIGWVDTKLYAQVIDVFLDSFPFPSGLTAYQSMAAGKPVVLYASPESRETGVQGLIAPALSGEDDIGERHAELSAIWTDKEPHDLFCLAKDTNTYLNLAERLLRDDGYRHKVGAAGRQFMERFMSSPKEMGESYSRHILEIIAERTGQTN